MGPFDEQLSEQLRRFAWSPERIEQELARRREGRRLYSDANDEPTLKESFAVYLDGLGTRAAVAALDDDRLREQMQLLRYRWFLHDDNWKQGYQRFLSFTDNVIVGTPVTADEWGEHAFDLGMLIDSVRGYQMNMTARGNFLRGGIARGPLYMDDRFVTGAALVDAVALEEEVAVYPRVILSQRCTEGVLRMRGDWSWDDALLIDADGSVFVNYLKVIDADEMPGEVDAGLTAHRDIVEARLREFASPSRIREKYRWVAEYHNYVAVEFFGNADYLIADSLTELERALPRQFRRLP